MKKVLIINGPNLNMLGRRPKEHYGTLTLSEINELIVKENNNVFELDFYQSNCEGAIVTKIQECLDYFAIIINPAAYTHTSVAIHDALEMFLGITKLTPKKSHQFKYLWSVYFHIFSIIFSNFLIFTNII